MLRPIAKRGPSLQHAPQRTYWARSQSSAGGWCLAAMATEAAEKSGAAPPCGIGFRRRQPQGCTALRQIEIDLLAENSPDLSAAQQPECTDNAHVSRDYRAT